MIHNENVINSVIKTLIQHDSGKEVSKMKVNRINTLSYSNINNNNVQTVRPLFKGQPKSRNFAQDAIVDTFVAAAQDNSLRSKLAVLVKAFRPQEAEKEKSKLDAAIKNYWGCDTNSLYKY